MAPGLSKSHNRTEWSAQPKPERRSITVFHGAGLIEIQSLQRGTPTNPERRATRGKITAWSAKSRMHCRTLLCSLKREALQGALFATLTYPAVFPAPDDHAVYKSHLHRLCQELRRRHGGMSGVWKLEFQARGAAHFHFLLIGCSEERRPFRSWLELTWARIVASGDPKHVEAGTEVTAVRSHGGVMAYVTSYISKDDQTLPGNFTGRYWGILNRAHLPVAPATTYEVTERQAIQINRWKRTLTRKYQEHSRWNTWAKLWQKLPAKLFWLSRTEFEHAWSKRLAPRPEFRSHCFDLFIPKATGGYWTCMAWSALLPELGEGKILRPPRRVRGWKNSGGALLCNASAFWNAVQRAIDRGLLN
jgi:hypothetical protein